MLPIFYLNLPRRTDRREFMEAQFSQLGLSSTRIEALTIDDLSDEDFRRTDPIGMAGGLCCTRSHLKAMKAFLDLNGPGWALILEDDAVLAKNVPAFLSAFEASPPPNTLLVRVEAASYARLSLAPQAAKILSHGLHPYLGWHIGAAAYLVSREAAKVISECQFDGLANIDRLLFDKTRHELARRLRALQLVPPLADQAANLGAAFSPIAGSDLEASRAAMRARPITRLSRFLHRHTVFAFQKAWWRLAKGATRSRVPLPLD